jgi:aspartate dehydrogenase
MDGAGPKLLGLIGYGALAQQITAAFPPSEAHWVVVVRSNFVATPPDHVRMARSLAEMLETPPVAVVEAAGPSAVVECVPVLLRAGIPVAIGSVGALADPDLWERLKAASAASGAPFVTPSGAIGGLDYIGAIANTPGALVRYTSRKPFSAWGAELDALGRAASPTEVVLFEGAPAEAARRYPKNLNVAVTLALAADPAPVVVRIVADPSITANTHEIDVESAVGTATLRFANLPSPNNPKTSQLTGLSMLAALRKLVEAQS